MDITQHSIVKPFSLSFVFPFYPSQLTIFTIGSPGDLQNPTITFKLSMFIYTKERTKKDVLYLG